MGVVMVGPATDPGSRLGRERSGRAAGRGDHGHLSADQIGNQRRQAIVVALQPVVLDRYVLTFDVAGFVEAFAERDRITREGSQRRRQSSYRVATAILSMHSIPAIGRR